MNTVQKILVCVDFSDSTAKLLKWIETAGIPFTCHLDLLHVAAPDPSFVGYEIGPQYIRDERAKDLKKEHADLYGMASNLREKGFNVSVHLLEGATSETILEEAQKLGVDLILLGKGMKGGVKKILLGSVSKEVLHDTTCPVLVIP